VVSWSGISKRAVHVQRRSFRIVARARDNHEVLSTGAASGRPSASDWQVQRGSLQALCTTGPTLLSLREGFLVQFRLWRTPGKLLMRMLRTPWGMASAWQIYTGVSYSPPYTLGTSVRSIEFCVVVHNFLLEGAFPLYFNILARK
jgi:hypothetical protein